MRSKEKPHTMEMKHLENGIESIYQRVVKIDPFDVSAYRALASVKTFARYILFWCIMNQTIVLFINF